MLWNMVWKWPINLNTGKLQHINLVSSFTLKSVKKNICTSLSECIYYSPHVASMNKGCPWMCTVQKYQIKKLYIHSHCWAIRPNSSQERKSIFSFLLGPFSHSLYGKWAFCCPFNVIIGAVQSSALWAEASALHWVSGHTLQSKCCVSPCLQ